MTKYLLIGLISLSLWTSGCACSNRYGIYDLREYDFQGHHYKQWSRDRVFALTMFGCGHYEYMEIDGKSATPIWVPEVQ